jgi:hypothetical protein
MSNVKEAEPKYRLKLNMLPDHMRGSILRWIENGTAPGHFLTAVLCNDLREAFGRADEENTAAMKRWMIYLYNYAPTGCWGSPERFAAWQDGGGLGLEKVDQS